MKKWRWAAFLVVALLLVSVAPSYAGGRSAHWHGAHWHGGPRVFVGFGPVWGPWWYPPPAYVYGPPTVVVQQPPVFVEQQQTAPPAAVAPAPAQQYWYYCQSVGAYYPNVATCQEAWVKVPARSQ